MSELELRPPSCNTDNARSPRLREDRDEAGGEEGVEWFGLDGTARGHCQQAAVLVVQPLSVLSRDGRAAEVRRSGLERGAHRAAAFAEDAELRRDDFRREPLRSGGPDLNCYADPTAGGGRCCVGTRRRV